MKLPIKPVFNRMIVKREREEDGLKYDGMEVKIEGDRVLSKTGFVIAGLKPEDVYHQQSSQGEILACGKTVVTEFNPGMKISWGKYAGTSQEFNGVRYEIINDDDVLFIIEEDS